MGFMIIVDLLKAFAENDTADKKNLERQREIKKELEAKRLRLGYAVGFFSPLRRKISIINILLVVTLTLLLFCEIVFLSSVNIMSESYITVSIGIVIPIYICGLTYYFTSRDNTIKILVETEREVYSICEYIFIHDKLSDEEKKLYNYFTQYRVRNGWLRRREFNKMLKSIKL